MPAEIAYFTHAFKTAYTSLYTFQRVGNLGSKISLTKASEK